MPQYIGLDIAKDQLGKSLRNFHTAQVSIHVVQADSTGENTFCGLNARENQCK